MLALYRRLLVDVVSRLGWRAPAIAVAMIISDLLEGVGLTLLIPLLSRLGLGQNGAGGLLGRWVDRVLDLLHLGGGMVPLLGLLVLTVVVQHGFFLAQSWLLARSKGDYVARWRMELFTAMIDARWRFFTRQKAGVLANTLLQETQRTGQLFHIVAHQVESSVLVLIYLLIAFAAAWPIALAVTFFGALMFLVTSPLMRRGARVGLRVTEQAAGFQTMIGEFLGGAKLIKATGSEERATATFAAAVERDARFARLLTFYPNFVRSLYEVVAIVFLAVCLWLGLEVFAVDAASIMVSVYIFVRIYQRLSLLQQDLQSLRAQAAGFDAVLAMLADAQAEAEPVSPADAAPLLPGEATAVGIRIRDLTVRHDDVPALDRISLDIAPGAVLGIAGPSGAGKSTLIDSLLGLVTPQAGSIEISGQPLSRLSLRAWRRMVGYVPQDTFLFNDSIRANIGWGSPGANNEAIERAARQARVDAFACVLPAGLDTVVGDRGVRLSGGQRQRIGLARALVGHARLLILDEATSALDSESEGLIMEAMTELHGAITIIIVAHRLATLRIADTICFVENGRVVESGTWQELNLPTRRFHDFWRLQSDERHTAVPG